MRKQEYRTMVKNAEMLTDNLSDKSLDRLGFTVSLRELAKGQISAKIY